MRRQIIWFATLTMLLATAQIVASAQSQSRIQTFGDSEYRLGPEDVVEISVWKEPEFTGTAVVRPDGKITVQHVGEIIASGKTARELETEIGSRLEEYLTAPRVSLTVREINSPKVSVFGEVRRPDVYPIKQKTTVLDAVALAGGTTEFAKTSKVVVIRDGTSGTNTFKLNLDSMVNGGSKQVFYLQPGDTVYVP